MESSSSKYSLIQEDRLASIRRRNKTLITIFFSFIILLAIILGGIIICFVLRYDFKSQSPNSNLAVKEFCSASQSMLGCINYLSSSINTTRHMDPVLNNTLSLEAAQQKLYHVNSILSRSNSGDIRVESALRNCWSALRGLDGALAATWFNPFIETQAFEQMFSAVRLIEIAMEALKSCGEDLEKTGSTVVDEAGAGLHEVEVLLRNSRDYLENFEWVSANFRGNDDYWPIRKILEYVADVSLFGSQYLVLIFLFCLLLRK